MEQTFIYEYLGVHSDPVYQMISKLTKGNAIKIGNIDVSLNKFGLYEVTTQDSHDSFRDVQSCYEKICDLAGDYKLILN